MAIHGYTILELAREKKINKRIKREVVNRVEKHNVISPYVSGLLKQGNLWYMTPNTKIYPTIDKLFGGCLLTDRVNPNGDDVSGFFGMIASDSNITAQCSNDAYNGNNPRRGSYNSSESGVITGGYRHVFDWSTDRGNGTISSVMLTKPQIARADFSDTSSRLPADDSVVNENLKWIYNNADDITINSAFLTIDVVDYENEVGYSVSYESGTITVTEYELNTKIIHILGATGGVRSTSTHNISQSVDNYSSDWSTVTVAYESGYIHLLTFTANGTTLNDYSIDISDWTCTATTHTFSGVAFTANRGLSPRYICTNTMMIRGGYLFAFSGSNAQKIVKCNLSNDADITEFDNPVYSVAGLTSWGGGSLNHGSFLPLPNGDFYIIQWEIATITPAVYFHNGSFYYCKRAAGRRQRAIFSNNYGTIFGMDSLSDYGGTPAIFLDTMFPWVSTVNNLDSAVTKSADLAMKLTYEITEVAS